MPSEEHEPPKLIPQASACARAAIPLPATYPVEQRLPGAGLSCRSGRASQARGFPAPSRARCRSSLCRKGAPTDRAPGSPGGRASQAKVGAPESTCGESSPDWRSCCVSCLAEPQKASGDKG